jgi:hypothetical protein
MKPKRLILYALFFLASLMVNAQEINEIQMFRSSDYYTNDMFGFSAQLDDNFTIVGAHEEDEDENGVNPVLNSGSAYFFEKTNNVWSQYQKIKAPDRKNDDNFGYSVSISGDFAVIGARRNDYNSSYTDSIDQAGAIYIFYNNNGNWQFFQKITAATRTQNEYFGSEVKISGDYIFVGSMYHKYDASELNPVNGAGAVLIFKFNGTQWILHQKVLAPVRISNSYFGSNFQYADSMLFVGASDDKTNEVNSGVLTSAGSAYIFKHNGITDQFEFIQKIIAPDRAEYDRFGGCVSGNQKFIIVAARYEDEDQNGENTLNNSGSVYIFENNDNNWVFFQKIVAPDRRQDDEFGKNVEFENNCIYVSVPYNDYDENNSNYINSAGALYMFSLNQSQTGFDFKQKFVTSDRGFASYFSVGFGIQNNHILAGSANTNKIYYLYVDSISLTNPQNKSVCSGDTTFFKITAQNYDNLQWQIQNGVDWDNLTDNGIYSGTQTDSLIVVSSNSLNQKNFRCRVSEQVVNKYTDIATLTVDTFVISVAGENQIICNIDNVQLNANNPVPNSGIWFTDNSAISFDNNILFNTTAHYFSGTTDTLFWIIDNGVCGIDSSFIIITFDNLIPVPDIATLPDITAECEVTVLSAPTATDNCAGTIIGTTSDPTEYTEQGTYTITWTFDDGNGNSIDVEQTVIIEDVTNPTIECIENQVINLNEGETFHTVQGTEFDPISSDDNCSVASVENDFNNLVTLENSQLTIGTTTIVWTITDIADNSANCSCQVTVNAFVGIADLSVKRILINPNPTTGIVNFEFAENNIQKIIISDITGKQIIERTGIQQNEQIDLSGFDSGIYIISIQTDKEIFTTKLIKE